MILELLLACVCIYFAYLYWSGKEERDKYSKIKSEPGLPLLGHAHRLRPDNILQLVESMWINLGRDKFLLRLGFLKLIFVTKPEDIEVVANKTKNKSYMYDLMKCWLGEGLLTTNTNLKWHSHRKIISPVFNTISILESYLRTLDKYFMDMFQDILEQAEEGKILDVAPCIYKFGFIFVSCITLNFKEEEYDALKNYAEDTGTLMNLLCKRIFSSWKYIDFLYKLSPECRKLKECIASVHRQNLYMLNKNKEEMKDLIDSVQSGDTSLEVLTENCDFKFRSLIQVLLLSKNANGSFFTDEEIFDEVNTFMVAGSETVTRSFAFVLYCLAENPDCQEKVYQEQLTVTGGNLTAPITYKDIQQMKYLHMFIKETLRMYPVAPILSRQTTEDLVLSDSTLLPEGSILAFSPYLTHRNPDIYPDPSHFKPERFLNKFSTYAYIPFGAGPRNCIGQRLAMLFLNYWTSTMVRLAVLESADKPVHPIINVVMGSLNGVNIRLKKRNN